MTAPYRQELQALGVTLQPQGPGIWRFQAGPAFHPTWVLETEVLAGLNHPLLTVVSPAFLERGVATYQLLRQGGYTELVVYTAQQIKQFRLRGEEFAMQHLGAEDELKQVLREILDTMSPAERLEGLSEEQLKQALSERQLRQILRESVDTMSPAERLELVSDERFLRGPSPEQLERLRRLLDHRRPADGNGSGPETA